MIKTTIQIDGMACGMCEAHINEVIREHFSVKKLKSSFKKGTTEFMAEEAPSEEDLRKVIDPTGYTLRDYHVETAANKHLFW